MKVLESRDGGTTWQDSDVHVVWKLQGDHALLRLSGGDRGVKYKVVDVQIPDASSKLWQTEDETDWLPDEFDPHRFDQSHV